MIIAHEIRHAYQYYNKWSMGDIKMIENDAVLYEKVAFDKLFK
jgi:hypothetical protein